MTMPFYVSPEQVMKDRADYARKGIARGRSLVAMSAADGIVIVAENPSRTLYKISEIYDRIAFAGVGKYNEFEMLQIAGVRQADLKGYSFAARTSTRARSPTRYAQTLGQVFTHEMKPYEVEILVAQVGEAPGADELFHILYDGTVMDEEGYTVLGGQAETIAEALSSRYQRGLDRCRDAVRLGADVLVGPRPARRSTLPQLEVAVLDRAPHRPRVPPLQGRRARGAADRLSTSSRRDPAAGVTPRQPAEGACNGQGRPADASLRSPPWLSSSRWRDRQRPRRRRRSSTRSRVHHARAASVDSAAEPVDRVADARRPTTRRRSHGAGSRVGERPRRPTCEAAAGGAEEA